MRMLGVITSDPYGYVVAAIITGTVSFFGILFTNRTKRKEDAADVIQQLYEQNIQSLRNDIVQIKQELAACRRSVTRLQNKLAKDE